MEATEVRSRQPQDDEAAAPTVSPPVAAELARILPPGDAAPSAGALRIECVVLASWIGSLVMRMLAVLAVARERSDPAAAAIADAGAARGSPE